MKLKHKALLSKLSFLIMIGTIIIILIWFLGFLITISFNLNVFDAKTSGFLVGLLSGAFVLTACSAILNISLNISIIADSKLQEIKDDDIKINLKRVLIIFATIVVALTLFLFTGDYLSRKYEKDKLINEGMDIVKRYNNSVEKIAEAIKNKKESEIPNILKFLSNLKQEFPSVIMITSSNYNGELAFLEINTWMASADLNKPYYNHSFYKCSKNDCDYLTKVFKSNHSEKYLWNKDNDYVLYIPYIKDNIRFILMFSKYKRFGKIGSDSYRQ